MSRRILAIGSRAAHSSQLASWAHGIVHLMEGHRSNAGYWYRRAEHDLPDDVEIESAIVALEAEIAGV